MSSLQPLRQLLFSAFLALFCVGLTACDGGTPPAATVPPNGHYPILMITGFGGLPFFKKHECMPLNGGPLTEPAKTPVKLPADAPEATFGGLAETLREKGYQVTAVPIISNPCYSARIKDDIPVVATAIADLKAKTGADKVIIFAHSTGGVAARAYLETPVDGKLPDDVSDLFTFGAPHAGVSPNPNWFGILFTAASNDPDLLWYDYVTRQEVFHDFNAPTMTAYNKTLTPNPNVDYHFYGGQATLRTFNTLGKLMNLLYLYTPNDGLISTESAVFREPYNDEYVKDSPHSGDFGSKSYFLQDSPMYNPVLTALANTALKPSTPTGVPSAMPVASPTPEATALASICDARSFVGLMDAFLKEGGGPSPMAPAITQYVQDCLDSELSIEDMIYEARTLSRDYKVQYTAVESSKAFLAVADNNAPTGRITGFSPDLSIGIPNSHAVQMNSRTYVVYADTEVTPQFIALTPGPFRMEVLLATGQRAGEVQEIQISPTGPGDTGEVDLSPISSGQDIIVRIRPRGGEQELIQIPTVRRIPLEEMVRRR